ncbi:hypothetical protein EB796_017542 [Bugula neritina]|uniref:Uncharacterized protein n=1 Tax=Bugula neritina TaxID=10212 RepID=A0A7J7JDQ2_BUGNE|nr:hypothetical protein EB796_017542 [Bugula neritina]
MIAVLFHHCLDEIWAQRIEDFVPFQHKNSIVGNTQFEHLVTRFLTTGLLDEAILFHLLEAETNFAPHVAIKLLSSFCILYGPMIEQKCSTYIVPNFSLSYIGRQWETDGYLQLRIKVVFNNLPLPRYVFQLMTVALLNFDKDVAYPAEVFHNGTSVRHGKSATHLVHDPNSGSVTIQVSTPVETISSSWQRLIKVMKFIINQTTSVWKAACPEALVYCAHCLFKQAENPDCLKNPSWLSCFDPNQSYKIWLSTKVGELPELVTCTNAEFSKTGEPAVPKQLRYPCK